MPETTIYQYAADGTYIQGKDKLARLAPIGGEPLIPAFSTIKPPPTGLDTHKTAVYLDADGNVPSSHYEGDWQIKDDYRDVTYYDEQAQIHVITKIGEVPEPTWSETKPFILTDEQAIKANDIRDKYNTATLEPVIDANGISWNGGWDSSIKLDAAKRLSESVGLTSVKFYDSDNQEHDLLIAEALTVVVTVANDFQVKLAKKQSLMRDIDAATTHQDLDAIVW